MIEVFKTNVDNPPEADTVLRLLAHEFPDFKVNFDLEDCDKILRVKGTFIDPMRVVEYVVSQGFDCEILDN